MELVIATLVGFLSGALVPLIGLWTQSRWKRREITLKHEETLFQKRIEIATKTIRACYNHFTISHKYATAKEEKKLAFLKQRSSIRTQIFEIEPEVDLFFPSETVMAFRNFLSSVDATISSETHWTVVGSRLDKEFTTFVNKVRADLGIEATESNLTQSLPQSIKNS